VSLNFKPTTNWQILIKNGSFLIAVRDGYISCQGSQNHRGSSVGFWPFSDPPETFPVPALEKFAPRDVFNFLLNLTSSTLASDTSQKIIIYNHLWCKPHVINTL